MSQTINTNVASLNAQHNLDRSQGALQTSLQRLSTGLRINSAKDDAAGLAISDRFTTQIRGLGQAIRNANDGISLAQTGEGALGEVTTNLQRIRELAVQAANATNSTSDRAAINLEVQQRLAEIDRSASQTSFNGQKILDGSFGSATFQVGANAGETIGLSLNTSVRTADIGQVASTISGALGAAAVDGSITRTPTGTAPFNFGTAAAAATSGSLALNATSTNYGTTTAATSGSLALTAGSLNFGTTAAAQVNGTSQAFNPTTLSFGTAGVALVEGSNNQTVTGYDFSGAGLAQFNVDGIGVTLTTNLVNDAGLEAELESQLAGYTVTVNAPGDITIRKTGSAAAVAITSADANAVAAGFADSAGTAGTAAVATTNATFTVSDGAGGSPDATITLNQDYASDAALLTDLNTQLGGNYTAAVDGLGNFTITNVTGGTQAVDITAPDANATAAGITATTGTAGTAAVASTNASFTIDGINVVLNNDYASAGALATDIGSQLGAAYTVTNPSGNGISITKVATGAASTAPDITVADANATAQGFGIADGTATAGADAGNANGAFVVDGINVSLTSDYGSYSALATEIGNQLGANYSVVSGSGGAITISKTAVGAGSSAPDITGSTGTAATTGFGNTDGTATNGAAAVASTNVGFTVDGQAVNLTANYADLTALAAGIDSQLSSAYSVIVDGSNLRIEHDGSTSAVAITGADANAIAAGFTDGTGVAGSSAGAITLASGAFTLATGSNTAVDLAGTYSGPQGLADAINSKVNGVYATVTSGGALQLTSAQDIALGGSQATGALGFASTTATASNGALSGVNTLTVAAANETLQRIDSALGTVNALRGTFGAIQNRFDSVISSLSATTENATAARSRIQDADFAAETAALTRGQILQQAGIAMLSQANQLPQAVLALLR